MAGDRANAVAIAAVRCAVDGARPLSEADLRRLEVELACGYLPDLAREWMVRLIGEIRRFRGGGSQ